MERWIAYEHDETGWPTEAFLVVTAKTQDDARHLMAEAITERRGAGESRTLRARLSEIFIEAPAELATDDPRAAAVRAGLPVFDGFDDPAK